MNEDYETCHQLILNAPDYVPRENATVTYLLFQVSDTPDQVSILGRIINPTLSRYSTLIDFARASQDLKIALLGLKSATKALQTAHKEIQNVEQLGSDPATRDEAFERVRKMFTKTASPREK